MTPDELDALAGHLLAYDQADEEGIMCLASRQAVDEAAAALRSCADRLRAAQEWHDGIFDGLAADLENGVRWLNEEAAAKFRRDYPSLAAALDRPMEPPAPEEDYS